MAMDVAQIAAWEWDVAERARHVVDGSRDAVRISRRARSATDLRGRHPTMRASRRRGERVRGDAVRRRAMQRPGGRPTSANTARVRPDGVVVWITERGRVLQAADWRGREDRRRQPRRQRAAAGGAGARAAAGERASRARRGRASEPHQGRIPRDAEPRAADADERDSRLAQHADDGEGASRSPEKAIAVIERNAQLQAQADRRPARDEQADVGHGAARHRAARSSSRRSTPRWNR